MAAAGGVDRDQRLALIERSLARFVASLTAGDCHGSELADTLDVDPSLYPYLEAVLTEEEEEDGHGNALSDILELMRAYVPLLAGASDGDLRDWLGRCRLSLTEAAAAAAASAQESGPADRLPRVFEELTTGEAESAATEAGQTKAEEVSVADEALQRLRALFPEACALWLRRRLAEAAGDLQATVERCLEGGDGDDDDSEECGGGGPPVCPRGPPCACLSAPAMPASVAERGEVKSFIMSRFEHYQLPDERKVHRPEARFDEQPRLTRYLDGQVVAKNGARFVEIKDEREEEIRKATTVCIRPARKYRFH